MGLWPHNLLFSWHFPRFMEAFVFFATARNDVTPNQLQVKFNQFTFSAFIHAMIKKRQLVLTGNLNVEFHILGIMFIGSLAMS